jgi:hypothetical protein
MVRQIHFHVLPTFTIIIAQLIRRRCLLLDRSSSPAKLKSVMPDVAGTSYYTPFWAGIENNWFRDPAIEAVWKPEYDKLVEQLVEKHAPYIYPFAHEILSEVDRESGTSFARANQNHDYFILTRAYQLPQTRQKWLDAIEREKTHVFVCPVCATQIYALHLHPNLIREHGTNPPWCRTCNDVSKRFGRRWDDEIKGRLGKLVRHADDLRACDICFASFKFPKDDFKFGSFGGRIADLVYPNLFARICPNCFEEAFRDHSRGSTQRHLDDLYQLFILIGKVPTQDFESLYYIFKEKDHILELTCLLRKMRKPWGYADEFGSYFAALIKAGVLPEGSRKMTIGTMTLSKDGHLCFSLPEKEIDDFLHVEGIAHEKEVYYPGSALRADWEVFGGRVRTFIEYFGLMNNQDYARKAKEKTQIALTSGIELIALFPNSDWKVRILNWKSESATIAQDRPGV